MPWSHRGRHCHVRRLGLRACGTRSTVGPLVLASTHFPLAGFDNVFPRLFLFRSILLNSRHQSITLLFYTEQLTVWVGNNTFTGEEMFTNVTTWVSGPGREDQGLAFIIPPYS